MDAQPLACPLCGAVVAPADGLSEMQGVERHLAQECPVKVAA